MADHVYWLAEEKLDKLSDVLSLFRSHSGWKNDSRTMRYLAFGFHCSAFQSKLTCNALSQSRLQSPVEFLISLYREHGSKRPFCDSIFDLKEQLVALQLVMAKLNKELFFGHLLDSKKEKGEFSVKLQNVFEAHKSIMKNKITMDDDNESPKLVAAYNKFLSQCNAVDFADILQRVKTTFIVDSDVKDKFQTSYQFVAVGNPKTQLEEQILHLISGNKTMVCFTEGKDGQYLLTEKTVDSFLHGCPQEPQTHHSPTPSKSRLPNQTLPSEEVAKDQLLQVLLSYLRLLVNTRDELALSQAINIPHRGLAHQQFTALRKVARDKNMPMFQTAVSFILRIRLGGKSYAPGDDNPLLSLTKGLGEFVTFFQKLQNICEETADAKAAVLRILNILRVSISKSKEKVFTSECLTRTVESLQQKVEQLSSETYNSDKVKSTMAGMNVYFLIQSILDQQVKDTCMQDYQTSNVSCALTTPEITHGKSKVRSLLTQFRTPDAESLKEDVPPAEDLQPSKPIKKPFESYRKVCGDMSWAKSAVSIKIGLSPDIKRDKMMMEAVKNDIISSFKGSVNEHRVEGTPKCRTKKRTLTESMNDKENLPAGNHTDQGCDGKEMSKSPAAKRMLLDRDTTGRKNTKTKATGKIHTKRKKIALLQGQMQLTNFFR